MFDARPRVSVGVNLIGVIGNICNIRIAVQWTLAYYPPNLCALKALYDFPELSTRK